MKNSPIYLALLLFTPIMVWKNNSQAQVPVAELVKDINSGKFDSYIGYLTKINETNALMFAEDEYYGRELWITDGTGAGTRLVKDIAPGKISSTEPGGSATKPIVVDNILYFLADDGVHGQQLWRSNGSEEGTYAVTNFSYKGALLRLIHLTEFKKEVYFWYKGGEGYDLYKTGGSIAKTSLVKQFRYAEPTAPVLVKNELYFTGWRPGDVGFALWKTNGTQSGTIRVGPIFPKRPTSLTPIGNHLYCLLQDTGGLWKTDGTVNGTGLLRQIDGAGYGVKIFPAKGQGYFWSKERASFSRLWKTDGTLMGTMALSGEQHGNAIIVFNDRLYFSYQSKANQGQELWTTDGTPESTTPFYTAFSGNNPTYFTESGNMLYYYANVRTSETNAVEGLGIWQSDGTPLGTRLIGQLGRKTGLPRFPHFYGGSFGIAGEEEGPAFVALGKYLLFIGQGDKYPSNNEEAIGAELFRIPIPSGTKSAISNGNMPSSVQSAERLKPAIPNTDSRLPFQIKNVKRSYKRKNSKGDIIASAEAEFVYPEFTETRLNQLIRYKLVTGSTYEKEAQTLVDDHKEMLSSYKDDEIGGTLSQEILNQKVTVIRDSDHFLVLKNDYYGQAAGAAHGHSAENYWTYDKQKKSFLTLSDLFDNNGMVNLFMIAEATFRKNEKLGPQTSLCKNYFFDKCQFALADQFRLDKNTLVFVYNPYEGKSFAAGIWTLEIPYARIRNLFRPEYGTLIEQEIMEIVTSIKLSNLPNTQISGVSLLFKNTKSNLTQKDKEDIFNQMKFHLTTDGKLFITEYCPDHPFSVETVIHDLNKDGTSEVLISGGNTCTSGMDASEITLFIKDESGRYRKNLGFGGDGFTILPSKSRGLPDLWINGRGVCRPVWRWNGRKYAFYNKKCD